MATTTRTRKAPAKAAPATTAPKLRWTVEGGRENVGKAAQSATVGDRTYKIDRSGDAWVASVTVGKRKPTTLVEGTFAKAYAAIQAHHKSA